MDVYFYTAIYASLFFEEVCILRLKSTMEFSKKILLTNWVVTLVLTALVAALSVAQIDCSEVSAMAALSWAALGVDQGFYSWKAKSENKIKLTKTMMKEWADAYGAETVVGLVSALLSD